MFLRIILLNYSSELIIFKKFKYFPNLRFLTINMAIFQFLDLLFLYFRTEMTDAGQYFECIVFIKRMNMEK